MKRYVLLLFCVFPLLASASSVEWKVPTEKGKWSSPSGEAKLSLVKEKEKSGPFYRLELRRDGKEPMYVGELSPNIWIDNSWAGVVWLESSPYAWLDDKIFFQQGSFIAILDVKRGAFLVNNQTEFCQRIGNLRWVYVAFRGKNTFNSIDVLGIIGEGTLDKANIEVPAGFVDKAVINRVGASLNLEGLLLAPPVIGKKSIWVLVADGEAVVRLHQLELDSLKVLSTSDVTGKIPDLKAIIGCTRDGSIPENGKIILEGLLLKEGYM